MKKYVVYDIIYQAWFSEDYDLTIFEKCRKVFNTKNEIEKYRKALGIRKCDLKIIEFETAK